MIPSKKWSKNKNLEGIQIITLFYSLFMAGWTGKNEEGPNPMRRCHRK